MVVCSFRKTITRQAWRSQREDSSKNREPKQDGCRDWGIDQRDGRLDNSMEPRPGPWTSAEWAKGDQEATEDLEKLSLCLAGMANPSGRFRVASSRLIGLFTFVCWDFCVTGRLPRHLAVLLYHEHTNTPTYKREGDLLNELFHLWLTGSHG